MQRQGVYWRLYEAQARQESDQLQGIVKPLGEKESVA
jgi:hypothetical protein